MTRTKSIYLGLLAVLLAPMAANADPITGALTFSGDIAPTGGTDLATATGLDFLGDNFDVDGATDDFAAAGISAGDVGFIQDFTFNPLTPALVSPLWAIGGFEFALQDVTVVFQNSFFLILNGEGVLSGNGFDATPGTWNLTANIALSNSSILFNFSSGSAASPVPVPAPGTLALLGLGLFGMGLARRRRKV